MLVTTTIPGGAQLTYAAGYDGNGRLNQVNYPSGLSVAYLYNSLGYTYALADARSGQTYCMEVNWHGS